MSNTNTNSKSTGTTALIVLLLLVTIAALILATYAWAKYTSTQTGNATATVAKWDVSFTPGNDSFTGDYSHVVDGKIAPGTSGTFDVTVDPGSTEVCFDYSIEITDVEFLNGSSDTPLADSTVLKERSAAEGGNITLGMLKSHIVFTDESNNDVTNGTAITGRYDLNGTTHNSTTGAAATDGTVTVTWTWAYALTSGTDAQKAEYDAIDTAAGEYADANGLRMKVNYTATATQVNPNS